MFKKCIKLQVGLTSLVASIKEEEGQDLIEYALLMGFIGLTSAVLLREISDEIQLVLQTLAGILDAAG